MIASTGPGTTNVVTGLYEAQYASSRVLVITGQAETRFYGKGLSYVHEAENQVPMLKTVSRRVESPRHIDQLGPCLSAVVGDIYTGRPAPGALEVPIDLQYAEAPAGSFRLPRPPSFEPVPADIEAAVHKIGSASRRVIIAGGGVICADASVALTKLAEKLDAPVLTTVDGRGAIAENHPQSVGNYFTSAGIYQSLTGADLTIAVGTKFAVGVEGGGQNFVPPGELLQIDIDPNMVGRTHTAALGVVADAKKALEAIGEGLDDVSPNDGQFNETVYEARDGVRVAMRNRLGPDFEAIMDCMRERLPEDGLWVRDSTISAYNWGNQLFPIYKPRTSINPSSGAIGPGLPFSIGAAIGSGKATLVIHGDGGFMCHATELATAAQYNVPVVVCVMNDHGYGVLRWLQDTRFGRINETDLGKMDFVRIAQGMGVPAERAASVADMDAALERGFASGGPYLIDVDMEHLAPMEISIMPKKKAS
tara:strand:- start:223 stop:1656 length:1434 start_codon:yes stop_codon:yes gene_type:complete